MSWLREIDRWFIAEVLPHGATYRARAARLCGADDADDLVQEAYARVLGTADHRAIKAPRAFTMTIVHNLALERFRRASVVRIDAVASLQTLDVADTSPDAFAIVAGRSELEQLAHIIDDLAPQCARVLRMRKIHGMAPAAIAEALSLSVSTVEKHLAKGLALITKARRERDAQAENACLTPSSLSRVLT